jgi:hypothetical protein
LPPANLRPDTNGCGPVREHRAARDDPKGARTPADSKGNSHNSPEGASKCASLSTVPVHSDPDLTKVVDVWSTLPEAIKVGIMAMVKASTPGKEG